MEIDLFGITAAAVARRSETAPFLVLCAGVWSSFGPCVAPRFVALAACAAHARRPRAVLGAFLCGLISAYASFGFMASLLGGVRAYTSTVYAAVSLGLFLGGLLTIFGADHRHDTPRERIGAERSLGGVFLLGASFALVISPCCTPIVATLLAYTSLVGLPWYGAALLGLFALGHALPLLACGAVGSRAARALRRLSLGQAVSVTGGALMIALASYYALLV